MFNNLVTGALIAGFGAGILAAALHLLAVQPLLLLAETYETGLPVGGFDPVRDALTVLFFALTYVGFGLLLCAGMALRPALPTWRQGMLWGLAGFVAFQLAPAFGLPPEPPGLAGTDIEPRQIWWFVTVALTAAGLWGLTFGRGMVVFAGAALVVLPHLGFAPAPSLLASEVPGGLVALFATRTIVIGLIGWVTLGALCAVTLQERS